MEKKPIPIVGNIYDYFDDGKIRKSRREKCQILEIIPFGELNGHILSKWEEETKNGDWLYADETDFIIKGKLLDSNIEIFLTRTKDGGWFGFNEYLWNGRLDIDGSLLKIMI